MKQRMKKLLSTLVAAVMLASILSVCVSAQEEGVSISSGYYEIDNESYVVKKVLYNTFVGDFMKRIDAGSNTKQLFAADRETEVLNGFVTDDMILRIGNVDYSIEYYTLYDLGAKMKEYIAKQEESFTRKVLLDYSYNEGNPFPKQVQSSELNTAGFFEAGLVGGGNEAAGNKLTATVCRKDGAPYLELYTNRAQQLHLVTKALEDYSSENKYVGKYVVSEIDIKGFTYGTATQTFNATAADDAKKTGILSMSRYYYAKLTGNDPNNLIPANGNILLDNNKSDTVFFGNRTRFAMGGYYKTTSISRSMEYLSAAGAYTDNEPYNVKQYNTIFANDEKTSYNVKALYLSKNVTTESGTEFTESELLRGGKDIFLNSNVEYVSRISKGVIGLGANNGNSKAGDETTVKINDYKLYLAENLHTAINNASARSDVYINGASGKVYITDEETGYASVYKDADRNDKGYLKYIIPGTTVKELRDSVNFDNDSVYVWVVKSVDEVPVLLADSDIITEGCKMYVSAPTLQSNGAKVEKSVSLELANYGNATYTVDNGIYTVTRESENNNGVKFVMAAYDNSGKLISAKLAADKENSVTFDAFEAEPATIKVFVFRNLSNLLPVADAVPATKASTQE